MVVFLLLVIGYVVYDPFMVARKYDNYSYSFQVNRSYISTEMFLRNYQKEHYNSFIFGSSRIFGMHASSWQQHLSKDAKVFSFDAYGEKITGVYNKLQLLDKKGVDIKNVLLCIDTDFTFSKNQNEPYFLYIEAPLSSNVNWFDFHLTHFEAYLTPSFLYSLYAKRIFGIDNNFIRNHYYSKGGITFDSKTNEPARPDLDHRIQNEPEYHNDSQFYNVRDSLIISPFLLIDKTKEEALIGIKKIFDKHNTDYKVVINPLYDQVKLNEADMKIILATFGKDHVYDFSGRNTFTTSKYNYYEISHFRPMVGDSIMNIIYHNNK